MATGKAHACVYGERDSITGLYCWGNNSKGQLGMGLYAEQTVSSPIYVDAITSITKVAAGENHTCAIDSASQLYCWGYNYFGQLGDGTKNNRDTPILVGSLQNVTQIAAGSNHTCAVGEKEQISGLYCWGANYYYQLGIGNDTNDYTTPTEVAALQGITITALTTGDSHSCAIDNASQLYCWGNNYFGQVGDGTTTDIQTPKLITTLPNTTQISAGAYHTCAINDGLQLYCWGSNEYGQLGDGSTLQSTTPVFISTLSIISKVTTGDNHTCALGEKDSVQGLYCWGDNEYGQLGDGSTLQSTTPVLINTVSNITDIFTGAGYTCVLGELNNVTGVYCWGNNLVGQLGNGVENTINTPTIINAFTDVEQITLGGTHTCALGEKNNVSGIYCWGNNQNGQLGNGTTTYHQSSVRVEALANLEIRQVVTGLQHTCALTIEAIEAKVYCWGKNQNGQLGDGTTIERAMPILVTGLTHVTQITAGENYTCAVGEQDSVLGLYCWGGNTYGQLGDGTTTRRLMPTIVTGLANVMHIAAGRTHTCAQAEKDNILGLYCWGNNFDRQLGDGTTTNRSTPTLISSVLPNVTQISLGKAHTCALGEENSLSQLYCWGNNVAGQLGDGTMTNRATPTLINGLTDIIQISTGNDHTCAISNQNNYTNAYCWGANYSGQLGDSTTTNHVNPTLISSGFSPVEVIAGYDHTCALSAHSNSSNLHCWGDNSSQQSGEQALTSLTPVTNNTNTPPQITGDAVNAVEGTTGLTLQISNILANDFDNDSDLLQFLSITQPVDSVTSEIFGSVRFDIQNGEIVFIVPQDYAGTLICTYRVTDGYGGYASANITFSVLTDALFANGFED